MSHLEEVLGHDGEMQRTRARRSNSANPSDRILVRDLIRLWLGRAGLVGSVVPSFWLGEDSNSDLLVGTAFDRAA